MARRRRRRWIRTGLATACGLAFAGAVYGELVQPRLEWLRPNTLVGFGGTSVQLLPGDPALSRLLDSGMETVRASGLPGRIVLAEPSFFALDPVATSGSEAALARERREFVTASAPSAGEAGLTPRGARMGGGGPWWLPGIAKVGKLARLAGALHPERNSAATGTKHFVNLENQDDQGKHNQGNSGNQGNNGPGGILEVTVTPEPATIWLLAAGLIALALGGQMRRLRRIR